MKIPFFGFLVGGEAFHNQGGIPVTSWHIWKYLSSFSFSYNFCTSFGFLVHIFWTPVPLLVQSSPEIPGSNFFDSGSDSESNITCKPIPSPIPSLGYPKHRFRFWVWFQDDYRESRHFGSDSGKKDNFLPKRSTFGGFSCYLQCSPIPVPIPRIRVS